MFREMMIGKIHRAVITEANIEYMGSITIDEDMMDESNIIEHQKVQVVDVNNGSRFETYVIPALRGSKIICVNGAAARLVAEGDRVIIISYATLDQEEISKLEPKILFLDEKNESILP
jgi:aspartate 1-decarboxylase